MNDKFYFYNSDKHQSLQQADTIILGVSNQACPKVSLHILQYLQKSMMRGWEGVDFLPADKK